MSRPFGSKNKPRNYLLRALQQQYPGYHPVFEMARIAHTTDDIALAASMHKEIAQYVESKKRSIDQTVDIGEGILGVLEELNRKEIEINPIVPAIGKRRDLQ